MSNGKTPEMQSAVNSLAMAMFGRTNDGNACVTCGSDAVKPSDFRDALSRKEFGISGMCQKCQDSVFGV